ncbi:MAG: DUF4838 domain-containing protein [Clostridia bacterium]|nr:DUF4838 domain-containing protein [Clostridia bacterium]
MKAFFSILLALLMLLPLLVSCGEAPQSAPSPSEETSGSSSASEPATEEPKEPETDPFEGADPLPEELSIPECLKTKDGAVLGTIVLPKGAQEDAILNTAAQELQYHLKKVLGADFALVSRPGEDYGSIILATPAILPAVAEMFADDIAWLADLGSKETGKWGSDGFAIRQSGDDIYVIGNTSKGAMNGVYDLIEDNLGVLWTRADETKGLVYDELEEATIAKVDYREKSPFTTRGFLFGNERTNALMVARNKCNIAGYVADLGLVGSKCGHTVPWILTGSPIYDPEEPEYWETDEEGNCLWQEGSLQLNPFSDKTADAVAAYFIAQMEADPNNRFGFIGEEDTRGHGRCVPWDTEPFEYAPGEFVQPDDANYYSTVFFTMVNKIARKVKEPIPDAIIGTFICRLGQEIPSCAIEDNVMICYACADEDFTVSILDSSISEHTSNYSANTHWKNIPFWAENACTVTMYHYYLCNCFGTEFSWPIWDRIQADLKGYVTLGIDGVTTDGLPDLNQGSAWLDCYGAAGTCSNYWDMNELLCWLYQKLIWNPDEDIPSLITYFCDKVYGEASPYMQDYFRLMKQGFEEGSQQRHELVSLILHKSSYYRTYVKKTGIGHPVLDALEQAYNAAEGPVKDTIKYIWDTVSANMNMFRSF